MSFHINCRKATSRQVVCMIHQVVQSGEQEKSGQNWPFLFSPFRSLSESAESKSFLAKWRGRAGRN